MTVSDCGRDRYACEVERPPGDDKPSFGPDRAGTKTTPPVIAVIDRVAAADTGSTQDSPLDAQQSEAACAWTTGRSTRVAALTIVPQTAASFPWMWMRMNSPRFVIGRGHQSRARATTHVPMRS